VLGQRGCRRCRGDTRAARGRSRRGKSSGKATERKTCPGADPMRGLSGMVADSSLSSPTMPSPAPGGGPTTPLTSETPPPRTLVYPMHFVEAWGDAIRFGQFLSSAKQQFSFCAVHPQVFGGRRRVRGPVPPKHWKSGDALHYADRGWAVSAGRSTPAQHQPPTRRTDGGLSALHRREDHEAFADFHGVDPL